MTSSNNKPRFGIDIDGTVTTPDTLIPHINKRYNTNIVLDDVIEYDFYVLFPNQSTAMNFHAGLRKMKHICIR